jgi:hypothetical protein
MRQSLSHSRLSPIVVDGMPLSGHGLTMMDGQVQKTTPTVTRPSRNATEDAPSSRSMALPSLLLTHMATAQSKAVGAKARHQCLRR